MENLSKVLKKTKTNFNIEFQLPFTDCRKVLEKNACCHIKEKLYLPFRNHIHPVNPGWSPVTGLYLNAILE